MPGDFRTCFHVVVRGLTETITQTNISCQNWCVSWPVILVSTKQPLGPQGISVLITENGNKHGLVPVRSFGGIRVEIVNSISDALFLVRVRSFC